MSNASSPTSAAGVDGGIDAGENAGVTRADICAVAIAEAFRGDGERLCNPIGNLPLIGGRLAAATFEPQLALTDGFYTLMDPQSPDLVPAIALPEAERVAQRTVAHWNPYREMFGLLWQGKRHVMMGATQIDQYGNQNIAAIGDWTKPRRQLLGFRGAPGNTINHTTSYWVPNHSPRVFVQAVDVVCGIGYDRAHALGPIASRFHEVRRVVSNLAVFDFEATDSNGVATMRLRSLHPGVTLEEVLEATACEVVVPKDLGVSRSPTEQELAQINRLDPRGLRLSEVPEP